LVSSKELDGREEKDFEGKRSLTWCVGVRRRRQEKILQREREREGIDYKLGQRGEFKGKLNFIQITECSS
jgi:hypothetical protein